MKGLKYFLKWTVHYIQYLTATYNSRRLFSNRNCREPIYHISLNNGHPLINHPPRIIIPLWWKHLESSPPSNNYPPPSCYLLFLLSPPCTCQVEVEILSDSTKLITDYSNSENNQGTKFGTLKKSCSVYLMW